MPVSMAFNNRDPAIDILKAISGEDHGTDAAAWRAWLDRSRARKSWHRRVRIDEVQRTVAVNDPVPWSV